MIFFENLVPEYFDLATCTIIIYKFCSNFRHNLPKTEYEFEVTNNLFLNGELSIYSRLVVLLLSQICELKYFANFVEGPAEKHTITSNENVTHKNDSRTYTNLETTIFQKVHFQ